MSATGPGFVSLVGAGPWDPELITVAAMRRLQVADVVIADYLVNPALLLHCRPDAVVLQRTAGTRSTRATEGLRLTQAEINALLVEHAAAGKHVVRLKGGDPTMFARGAEEATVLRDHGIPFEFVPGVSSPIAAPQAAGIPVTHRDHTPAVTFVSGFEAYDKAGLEVAWTHLANSAGTIVLMMSVRHARDNARRLIEAGRDPATPAAVVRWGTRGIQRTVTGRLDEIADRLEAADIRPPAVLVIGGVVELRQSLRSRDQRPLHGRRVVVTRAWDQAQTLLRLLSDAGADAVPVPCLRTEMIDDDGWRSIVRRTADHDGILVTSPNGARALVAAVPDLRTLAGKTIAVVGDGTAAACRQARIVPDLVASQARAEGLRDALTAAGQLGQRWVHVCAADVRPVLEAAITEAGGTYTAAVAYRVTRPAVPPLLLADLQTPPSGEGMDAVCFASTKTAQYFIETLTEAFDEATTRAMLAAAKVVTIGPVTTAGVEALGIRVDATAAQASDEGLVAAVQVALSTA